MRKFLKYAILYGAITITIPDAKDASVVQARNYYNTRNGTALTIPQFVVEMLKLGTVNEHALIAQQAGQGTITTSADKTKAEAAAVQAAVKAVIDEQNSGW